MCEPHLDAPDDVEVRRLVRPQGRVRGRWRRPGGRPAGPLSTYVVGGQKPATTARKWLTGENGVPKANVTCQGYWRQS